MPDVNLSYVSAPVVLLATDTPAARAEFARLVHEMDGRIAATDGIDDAVERIDEAAQLGAVVVSVTADHGFALDRLLDRLDLAAREERFASVVCVTPGLIDVAAARLTHPGVALLCAPAEADRVAALAVALARPAVAPCFRESGAGQLKQLSEEVERIARTLAALSESDPPAPRAALVTPPDTDLGEPPTAATIRLMIRARRLREQYFAAELFADPAWDILLDLMAARMEGRKVAVSSLCIAAAVPATTALRWIKTLTDEGLLLRIADPLDGRRIFIELAEHSAAGLSAYFTALARLPRTAA